MPLAALALALALAAAPPPAPSAAADETPAWAKAYQGRWSLWEDGEGAPTCDFTIPPGMAIGGAAITLSPTCRRNFPLEDVAGWRLGDEARGRKSIVFIDALRKPVFAFAPAPDKMWQTALPDREGLPRGGFLLQRETEKERPWSLKAMLGGEDAYNLSGPNAKDWCGFSTTAVTATTGKLVQEGRCAKRWKGKGWASWEFAGGELKLKDRKGAVIVALKRGDNLTFIKDSPDDPLFFGPGPIVES